MRLIHPSRLVIFLSAAACADSDIPSITEISPSFTDDCTVVNCGNSDPEPYGPGIYLGDGINPHFCGTAGTDFDLDEMDDLCEERLATAFAPEMVSSATDDVRGETYWIVQPADAQTSGYGVKISYLMGYYWDFGSGGTIGTLGGGHIGDSEWVHMVVGFDSGTKHWRLHTLCMSAHHMTPNQRTYCISSEGITFPQSFAGYPRVWVALNKHAHYHSVSACEAGTLDDNCSYTNIVYSRAEVLTHRNIGSKNQNARSNRFLGPGTCRYSEELFAGNGHFECFWRDDSNYWTFGGWQQSGYDVATYRYQIVRWPMYY